mmetsp:Transcript_56656/g.137682  ORF Transcript_56656/g.137682 Transcript_56656/m.137682 type:complete len:1847 (+) Transcript_56656:196-5736(+)
MKYGHDDADRGIIRDRRRGQIRTSYGGGNGRNNRNVCVGSHRDCRGRRHKSTYCRLHQQQYRRGASVSFLTMMCLMTAVTIISSSQLLSSSSSSSSLRIYAVDAAETDAPYWSQFTGSTGEDKSLDDEEDDEDDDDLFSITQASPIINREIQVSVKAPWPTNPQHNVLCEAYAFLASFSESSASANTRLPPPQYRFLEALTESHGRDHLNTFDKATEYALEVWEKSISSSSSSSSEEEKEGECDATTSDAGLSTSSSSFGRLLKVALTMRAMSPTCELHRSTAQRQYPDQVEYLEAFVVIATALDPANKNGQKETILETSADLPDSTTDLPKLSASERSSILFPTEVVRTFHDYEGEEDSFGFVILYAQLGGHSFATFHQRLVELKIPFVVRHLLNSGSGSDGGFSDMNNLEDEETDLPVTLLQGYGVRLDVKNLEYKVFDDRGSDDSNKDQSTMVDLSSLNTEHDGVNQFLAGVNLTALGLDKFVAEKGDEGESDDETSNSTKTVNLRQELWARHEEYERQHQLIPPSWQRRKLSLQATAVIARSKHPLLTLQDVSQNLPSLASTLVHIDVPDEIQNVAEQMESSLSRLLRSSTAGGLWINGRSMNVARPSFNVFEMINMLQKEQVKTNQLVSTLQPLFLSSDKDKESALDALQKVQQAWIQGEAFFVQDKGDGMDDEYYEDEDESEGGNSGTSTIFRIDLATGDEAVTYMNDLEKDRGYSRLTTSVQQMLMGMQYGMAPSIRRNLFTILSVEDPLQESPSMGLSLAAQLSQQQFPARLGSIVVSKEDVDTCSKWARETKSDAGQPCPLAGKSWLDADDTPSVTEFSNIKLNARDIHRLLAYMRNSFKDQSEALIPYQAYLFSSLTQSPPANGRFYSLKDLFVVHNEILQEFQLSSKHSLERIAEDLLEDEQDSKSSYGGSVRFAVDKGLKPGMSFCNGRPLPDSSESGGSIQKIFSEEQQMVFNMVMEQKITDTKPRNFYYKLIKGKKKNVYPRLHPLLTSGSEADTTVTIQHPFTFESLLVPQSMEGTSSQHTEALFVFEAVLEIDTLKGLSIARDFLTTMNDIQNTIGGTKIGVKYRIIPSSTRAANSQVCRLFASAGSIEFQSTLETLKQLIDDPSTEIDESKFVPTAASMCADIAYLKKTLPSQNFITCNGRMYVLEDDELDTVDIELLSTIGVDASKAVTELLKEYIETANGYDAISRATSFLVSAKASSEKRADPDKKIRNIELESGVDETANMLRFAWNTDTSEENGVGIMVTAIVDPVTETAQRLSPLLLLLRDELKLPVKLIFAPRTELNSDSNVPISSYYRFVADATQYQEGLTGPGAYFSDLPSNHVLTLRMDVPEPWDVQQVKAIQDTDNLRCDAVAGCGDERSNEAPLYLQRHLTTVEYGLEHLLFFGQCYETTGTPPNGLQLLLSSGGGVELNPSTNDVEIQPDGTVVENNDVTSKESAANGIYSDTLVMKTVGYWQLRANPGVWDLRINEKSRGADIFDMIDGKIRNGMVKEASKFPNGRKQLIVGDFLGRGELLLVKRKPGYERASLFYENEKDIATDNNEEDVVHVFSLATGHLYERLLKIMILSVTKRTSTKVKFWLFENFLSPNFKATSLAMAKEIGCEIEFVTYKWPEWLRGQSEKQRIIWGYKILFLDVLFPLNVKKIIYVDADQVVRGDLKELRDMDLQGAPYGYTPMCSSNEETIGFQFWREGFWASHLRDKPYHISALYVVDLQKFRKDLVGDILRSQYQQLSADPNSLSNLDQDLPNYAQHEVPIFSLPQEWLWCESWCSLETKPQAKTIDLCNNPQHKEPKLSMAKRIISGELFEESWVELDQEVEAYDKKFLASVTS